MRGKLGSKERCVVSLLQAKPPSSVVRKAVVCHCKIFGRAFLGSSSLARVDIQGLLSSYFVYPAAPASRSEPLATAPVRWSSRLYQRMPVHGLRARAASLMGKARLWPFKYSLRPVSASAHQHALDAQMRTIHRLSTAQRRVLPVGRGGSRSTPVSWRA